MGTISPARGGPRLELHAIARSGDDLPPAANAPQPLKRQLAPLAWFVIVVIVLMAFVGWLLIG
jgi:hypothetical protein